MPGEKKQFKDNKNWKKSTIFTQIIEAVSTAFTIGNLNQIELQTSFYEPAEHTMMPFSDDSSDEE